MDRSTGQIRWSYETHGNRRAQLVAADGDLVAIVVDPPAASPEAADQVCVTVRVLSTHVLSAHLLSATSGQVQRAIPLSLTTPQKLAMNAVRVFGTPALLHLGKVVAFDSLAGVERWRAPGRIEPNLPSPIRSGRTDVTSVRTGAGDR